MASCCSPPPPPPPPHSARRRIPSAALTRRSLLLSTTLTPLSLTSSASAAPPPPDTTVTDRVFMDFSLCPNFFRPDRTFADSLSLASLCTDSGAADGDDSFLLGRVVLGLYGRLAPTTVSHFKALCTAQPPAATYRNTLVHKVFPGRFLLAGRQGDKPGEVRRPAGLARNAETVDAKSFALTHSRPGLLSLCLSENDDDDDVKLDPDYRNVEFLITTGPGPCPQLDYKNIVFGSVLEGENAGRTEISLNFFGD